MKDFFLNIVSVVQNNEIEFDVTVKESALKTLSRSQMDKLSPDKKTFLRLLIFVFII